MGTYWIGSKPTAGEVQSARIWQLYNNINNVLIRQGYPAGLRGIVIGQAFHESNDMNSRLAPVFNLTGIKYTKNSPWQSGKSGAYATYKNLDNWAQDHKRIINFNNGGQGKPWDTDDYREYARRLKANNFYEDTLQNYTAALYRKINRNNQVIKWANANKSRLQAVKDTGNPVPHGYFADLQAEIDTKQRHDAIEAANKMKYPWDSESWKNMDNTSKLLVGGGAVLLGITLINAITGR